MRIRLYINEAGHNVCTVSGSGVESKTFAGVGIPAPLAIEAWCVELAHSLGMAGPEIWTTPGFSLGVRGTEL